MTRPPFDPTFLSEPFTLGYDPVLFHGDNFADGQHRVVIMVPSQSKRVLYKTADFDTFTVVLDDWVPSEPSAGADTFQDAVVLGDGTFALYQNDGTEGTTAVWTGTAADIDAGTITKQGQVLSTEGDCGAFYEASTDTVHIYSEDADTPFGSVSSTKLSHWTTPADDLTNATQQDDAIDTGGSWGTGDPDVFEAFGCYWMLTDYTTSHPTYWVALYRSDDLYTWELVAERFTEHTGTNAGDFDVLDLGDYLIAMCEYTGGNAGAGVWRLDKRPSQAFTPAAMSKGGSVQRVTVGGAACTVQTWPHR